MSDPSLLTQVTIQPNMHSSSSSSLAVQKSSKSLITPEMQGKLTQIIWVMLIVILIAVVFLFLWHRNNRNSIRILARNQAQFATREQVSSIVTESLEEYHRRTLAVRQSQPIPSVPNAEDYNSDASDYDDPSDDDDEDEMTIDEEDEEDDEEDPNGEDPNGEDSEEDQPPQLDQATQETQETEETDSDGYS
jgi:FtsZ-interacting cell division protein ZipA